MYTKKMQTGNRGKIKRSTADRWFSLYIRLRDIVSGEFGRCVTCNRTIQWKHQSDCGHYATREKPMTRFNEQNAHLQCYGCNRFSKGEQAKHGFAIDRMYGAGTAQKLIDLSEIRGQKPYEEKALKEIAKEYRLKTREMAKKRGVKL